MKAIVVKYAGPFSKLTTSHAASTSRRSVAIAGMTYEPNERLWLSGARAASVAIRSGDTTPGEAMPPPVLSSLRRLPSLPDQACRRDDRLDGVQVLPLLLVDGDRQCVG